MKSHHKKVPPQRADYQRYELLKSHFMRNNPNVSTHEFLSACRHFAKFCGV